AWKVTATAELAKTGAAIAAGQSVPNAVADGLRRIAENTLQTAQNTAKLPGVDAKFLPSSSVMGDMVAPKLSDIFGMNSQALSNQLGSVLDQLDANVKEASDLASAKMPAIVDAGSYWSVAQSAIRDDITKQQLEELKKQNQTLTAIATGLQERGAVDPREPQLSE
ncbi:MAG: hypothetical protein KF805_12750, partial [Phycisphaeraceae bacterium]|nr:hypothetical protein [Phycisphaeraceae bacterium]